MPLRWRLACGVLLAVVLSDAEPTYAQADCASPWRLVERLQVGEVDGPLALGEVSGLAVSPDGRVYVTQAMVPEVWILGRDGELENKLGRRGQGPGEFQTAAVGVGWMGDTLWVRDLGRIQFFAPDGAVVGQTRVGGRTAVPLPDGTALVREGAVSYRPRPETIPWVWRIDRTGQIQNVLIRFEPEKRLVRTELGTRSHPLYTWDPALAPDGTIVTIEEATDDAFWLIRLSATGDTLLRRMIRYSPVPFTSADADRLLTEYVTPLDAMASVDARTLARRREIIRDAIQFPESFPPVREIVAGHDGTIWLLRESRADRIDVWEVYDDRGDLDGRVHMDIGNPSGRYSFSPRMRLLSVSRDRIWATSLGEFEVPLLHDFLVARPCN